MMRIALLSDIHGNSAALEAVLEDIRREGGAAEYWLLGDYAAPGPDPLGTLEMLGRLPNARFVRGNTDRHLVSSESPTPPLQKVVENPALYQIAVELAGSFGWTKGVLSRSRWLGWLAELPLELTVRLPGGQECLLVHAAPGLDDGDGIAPEDPDEQVLPLIQDCTASLICMGHIHAVMDRRLERWHLINPGCISNPPPGDTRPSYMILRADEAGYSLEHRLVTYDSQRMIDSLDGLYHPGADYLQRKLLGK